MFKKLVSTVAVTGVIFSGATAMNVSAETYEVQKQDTLWSIANQYETSVQQLMETNELNSDIIHPGQTITTDQDDADNHDIYIVEKGDTLSKIANQYGVEVDEIKDWNDLSDNLINIGQELEIKGVAKGEEPSNDASNEVTSDDQAETTEEASPDKEEQSEEADASNEASEPTSDDSSSNAEGETFSVSATAYTASCAGCSGVTATGVDLNANPNKKVIAVDPNVIPLGSEVHVEGYGNAIAADTGGAINGNKIDVHVPTNGEATEWGVRDVNVTVLD